MSMSQNFNIENLLKEHHLEKFLPVSAAGRRLGCTVWNSRLLTRFGDADAQIQVYSLGREPEAIVNYEEEITALEDASSGRKLVREIRNPDWGILVTCALADTPLFEKFFREGNRDQLEYHPQLDRLLGGDYFHQVNERWLKACLAPVERALLLSELLKKAEAAYDAAAPWAGKQERPFPKLLAVLQISLPKPAGAPAAYDRMGLMQFVVEHPQVIQLKPPTDEKSCLGFSRQIFGLLATQHPKGICFSRDAGCCLRPEFLLANGCLTDAYYMWQPKTERVLKKAIETDLWNALAIAGSMASNVELISTILETATVHYTGCTNLPKETLTLIGRAAKGMAQNETAALTALFQVLLEASRVQN
jgi:hypothetical protein